MSNRLDHAALVRRAVRWLRGTRRCTVVLAEPVAFLSREIPDAIGFMPSGYSIVVECKTTRNDFLRDKHKPSRRIARMGADPIGFERWYLVQGDGIICEGDRLFGWGVLRLRGDRCYKVAKPTIERRPIDPALPVLVAAMRRARDA